MNHDHVGSEDSEGFVERVDQGPGLPGNVPLAVPAVPDAPAGIQKVDPLQEVGVLPGVNEAQVDAKGLEGQEQGAQLDQLGPGAGNEGDVHDMEATALAAQEQAQSLMFRQFYSPDAITRQPRLWQWQRVFAAWLATVPHASMKTIRVYVQDLTQLLVSDGAIHALMAREDFRKLVGDFQANARLRIQELAEFDYPFYLDAHKKGLESAIAAGDHRAIPSFTVPMLDRAVPKKADEAEKAQVVVINMTPGQARALSGGDVQDAQVLEVDDGA